MKNRPNSKIVSYLGKFHLVIFLVIVTTGLAAALLMLVNVLNSAYSATSPEGSGILNTTFDENTIRELETFKTSDKNTGNQNLPSGRINPFSD